MRFEDWPQRLDAEIERVRTREFGYGDFDCCSFAADVVLAITGADPGAHLRGYDCAMAGKRIIAQYGSIEALWTALLGEPVHPAYAQRGDIALARLRVREGELETEGDCAGVCLGRRFAFPRHPAGLLHVELKAVRLAWRVT